MKDALITDSLPQSWVDAQYSLMPREVEDLDRIVYGVVRHRAIAQNYFPTVKVPKGVRYRKVAIAQELREPIFSGDFMTEDIDEVKKAEYTYYMIFMHKDFKLNMIDMDASEQQQYYNVTIETLNIREAVKTIADYKERALWRGYDALNPAKDGAMDQGLIDTDAAGICTSSTGDGTRNTFSAAGDNSGINSAGDGPLSIGDAMDSMIADQYYGPYVFVMTPDVYGQLAQNFNSTTHISDIERMQAMIDLKGNKILEAMDVTHYLIKAAASADNGAMEMFQRKTPDGEPTCVILESYPVSHHPIQMSSLGIKGKVIWGGTAATLRLAAFTQETSVDLIA